MRALLLVCDLHSRDGEAGQLLCRHLGALVRQLLSSCSAFDAEVDLDVRTQSQLADITPDRNKPISREDSAQFDRLKRFDSIDLIFLYGTPDFAPWDEHAQPARWLLRNCLLARKYVFAFGAGMQLVAFVLSTGGDVCATPIRSVDGAPLSALPPPSARLPADRLLLDVFTGELLRWDKAGGHWVVLGADCGSHLASGHPRAPYRHVDERLSSVRDLHFARDITCRQLRARVHPQAVCHPLIAGLIAQQATLEVKNRYCCHLRARGEYGRFGRLRALLTHAHGVQAFEVGNCVALQCELAPHTPLPLALARRFAEGAMVALSRLRAGKLLSQRTSRGPVQLAFIVGQPSIDLIPSELLDVVAALAPDADAARMAHSSQRGAVGGWGAVRGAEAAADERSKAAKEPAGSYGSSLRARPASARTRTVADSAPLPAAAARIPGLVGMTRVRPVSAHVRSAAVVAAERAQSIGAGAPASTRPRERPVSAQRCAAALQHGHACSSSAHLLLFELC